MRKLLLFTSTEAGTLLASKDDIFTVKNECAKLIKEIKAELLIHNSLKEIRIILKINGRI